MAGPAPLFRKKIVKKHKKTFKRHQCDRFARVGESWRKPKGIDGPVRRRFKGAIRMPKIGYKSDKETRFMLPNGFFKFSVSNVKDLDMLLMHNRTYCAEISHNVGKKTRTAILERARELNVKVLNGDGKLREEEN
eukprot:snap_masked-scaffold_6-processed-gene-15.47-mRNA-1 protein AED:0.16 eAED:0.16 QI:0/-1/0/1/-1/1/1/0/134